MITEQLAERSFNDYKRTIARLNKKLVPVYEDSTRVALRGDERQIDESLFRDAFTRWEPEVRDPNLLFEKSKAYVQKLLDGRKDHLNSDQQNRLAAELCAEDVESVGRINDDPCLKYHSEGNICYYNLPDSVSVGAQPKTRPLDLPYRDVAEYVGPRDGTIIGTVSDMISRDGPIVLLDAGVGGGLFCKSLKTRFGDNLRTVGVGLENSKLPIDESWIGPMEVMPKEWDNRFDVIFSNYALCYAMYPKKCLSELLRVLKPGRSAFLDIDREPSLSPVQEVVEGLLGIDRKSNFKHYAHAYAGLENYGEIKQTIEAMSNDGNQYEVVPAKGRDYRGVCVEVKKK